MDPQLLAAGATFFGEAMSSSPTSSNGPQWQAMNFGSYGSISSPGLFTGAAVAGGAGAGGGQVPGWVMLAGGVALVWVLTRKRGR